MLVAFYFVALPGAYLFAFPMGIGMVGLWWGVVVGAIVEVVLYFLILSFACDWPELALKISKDSKMKQITPNSSFVKMSPDAIRKWERGSLKEPFLEKGKSDNSHKIQPLSTIN